MLKLNETTNLEAYVNMPIDDEYAESYKRLNNRNSLSLEDAKFAIRGARAFWNLSGAMTEPENKDKYCKWVAVTSKAYGLIKKYLPCVFFDFKELSQQEQSDGLMAEFMGAIIVIDEDCHIPKGYSDDEYLNNSKRSS